MDAFTKIATQRNIYEFPSPDCQPALSHSHLWVTRNREAR